jgi:hypothetical protein
MEGVRGSLLNMAETKIVEGKLNIATCKEVVVGNECWLLEI